MFYGVRYRQTDVMTGTHSKHAEQDLDALTETAKNATAAHLQGKQDAQKIVSKDVLMLLKDVLFGKLLKLAAKMKFAKGTNV